MEQKTLFDIPVDEISPNPHNPRLNFDREELDRLKGSIQKVGILVPVTVYRNRKSFPKTSYVILDGERRWRCAKELGLATIPGNVIDEPKDVTQNILFMFNIHHYRNEWELLPTALKLEQLINALGTDNESTLSSFTGVNKSTIRRCKALLWYPKKYRDLLFEKGAKVNPDFFIELYPVATRLSQEPEYPFPDGVVEIMDKLIERFVCDSIAKDVKEFREIRKAMGILTKRNNFESFKDRLTTFITDPKSTLDIFSDGLEEERTVVSLLKHSGYVLSILEEISPDALSDFHVAQQLERLSEKIQSVLDEIE